MFSRYQVIDSSEPLHFHCFGGVGAGAADFRGACWRIEADRERRPITRSDGSNFAWPTLPRTTLAAGRTAADGLAGAEVA